MKDVEDEDYLRFTQVLVAEHEQVQAFGEGRSSMARFKALRTNLLKHAPTYEAFQEFLSDMPDDKANKLRNAISEAWDITQKAAWNNMTVRCRVAMLPERIWQKILKADDMCQKNQLKGQKSKKKKKKKSSRSGKGTKKSGLSTAMMHIKKNMSVMATTKSLKGQSLASSAGRSTPLQHLSALALQNSIKKCSVDVTENLWDLVVRKKIALKEIVSTRIQLMQIYRVRVCFLIITGCASLKEVEELGYNTQYTEDVINQHIGEVFTMNSASKWKCDITDTKLEELLAIVIANEAIPRSQLLAVMDTLRKLPDSLKNVAEFFAQMSGQLATAVRLDEQGKYKLSDDMPEDVRENTHVRSFDLPHLHRTVQVIVRLGDASEEKTFEHMWVDKPFSAAKCSVAFGWNMFDGDEHHTSKEEMTNVVRTFMKLNQKADECVFRMTTAPLEQTKARDALKDFHNLSADMEFTVWKKKDKELMPSNQRTFVGNIETAVTAYYSKTKTKSERMFHHTLLDSVWELPYVRHKLKDSDGNPYNRSEEHPMVSFLLLSVIYGEALNSHNSHFFTYAIFSLQVALQFFQGCTEHNDWVYIPYCGTGAEVEGAILAGLNVLCVDIRPRQIKGTLQRLNNLQMKLRSGDFTLASHWGFEEEGDEEDEEAEDGEIVKD